MLKRVGEWFMEPFKSLTDRCLISFLRGTSWFGRELTDEGEAEQRAWREQRLRSIRGLGLVSRRRHVRKEGDSPS